MILITDVIRLENENGLVMASGNEDLSIWMRTSSCLDAQEPFLNVDQGAAEGMSRLTSLDITFEKELVTYVEEYFTYDWQSFIGEVGGTFGLFLGVSVFTTLFDLIEFFNYSLKC